MIRVKATGEPFAGTNNLSPWKVEQLARDGIWTADDLDPLGLEYVPDPPPPEPEPEEPPRLSVNKSVVQQRIIDAGKIDDALAALQSNAAYFARWFAPDHPYVYCDDPDAVGLVMVLGLDPEVILAP